MMKRRAITTLLATSLSFSSAIAACDPATLNAAIDAYSAQPYSAETWRVLNGLGDPGIESLGGYGTSYDDQENWRKFTAEIAPENASLQNVGYECRIGYPAQVLQSRVKTLGKFSPYVKQWLATQAKVLEVCANPATVDQSLPVAGKIHPALASMQTEDRAYQDASIAFYGNKSKAVEMFRVIGASASTHRAAARYNVANLLANAKNVVEARKEAAAILADPSLSSVHAITEELQGYISNVEDTAAGWTDLIDRTVAVLSMPATEIKKSETAKTAYARAVYDIEFAGITRKRDDWWLDGTLPENPTLSKAVLDASRKHPMALWMMAGQSANDPYTVAPWSLVGKTWSARMTNVIDRSLNVQPAGIGITGLALDVLNVLKADISDASRSAQWAKTKSAIAAAETSCGDAPETAAVGQMLLHAVRISALSGQFEEIYANLDTFIIKSSKTYSDIVLPKLMQFLLAEGNAEEGRRLRNRLLTPAFLARFPANEAEWKRQSFATFMAYVAEDEAKWFEAVALSNAKLGLPMLNFVSIKNLWKLSENPNFSATQKALLVRAAWTRNYALGKAPTDDETMRLLDTNPELKAAFAKVAAEHPKLSAQRQRLLTILRNPRFGILVNTSSYGEAVEITSENFAVLDQYDHNDKNWWCPLETDRQLGILHDDYNSESGLAEVDGYYASNLKLVLEQQLITDAAAKRQALLSKHPLTKLIDAKELTALSRMASAPKQLAEAAIKWAKASKGDDGAPEALALAVQATRYGCNWHGRHGTYSKTAQELLKAKFPTAVWATQTPYWFDCMRREWDKDYNKVQVCEAKTWPKQPPLK